MACWLPGAVMSYNTVVNSNVGKDGYKGDNVGHVLIPHLGGAQDRRRLLFGGVKDEFHQCFHCGRSSTTMLIAVSCRIRIVPKPFEMKFYSSSCLTQNLTNFLIETQNT